jgi:hypothetical protein
MNWNDLGMKWSQPCSRTCTCYPGICLEGWKAERRQPGFEPGPSEYKYRAPAAFINRVIGIRNPRFHDSTRFLRAGCKSALTNL